MTGNIQCPSCGYESPPTEREIEYIKENGECIRVCIICGKRYVFYDCDGIFCTYYKE